MTPALHMRMSRVSHWEVNCLAALSTEGSDDWSHSRKVTCTWEMAFTSSMTAVALSASRPVKNMWLGSRFARARTDSLPKPAVPAHSLVVHARWKTSMASNLR